jgi:S-adenosylmethionine:tRNA ribosyltransferase-isomerase
MNRAQPRSPLAVNEFSYDLPAELIAQVPLSRRDASRLLVLDRAGGQLCHSRFDRLPELLRQGDLLVANNSRVRRARLLMRKAGSGGNIELLLLHEAQSGLWLALAKPARRLRVGTLLVPRGDPPGNRHDEEPAVEVVAIEDGGRITVRVPPSMVDELHRSGQVPLPPYIHERLVDDERYQTIYSSVSGSAAAPTAGLHFTGDVLGEMGRQGATWSEVTLHIGLDTFRPVTVDWVEDHEIHREWWHVPAATGRAIRATQQAGGRIIAVGTTAARTLETYGGTDTARTGGEASGMTDLFIVPGYQWRMVDALLTNFHLPRSTLLMMISSFGGMDHVQQAYAAAIAERYRFFSFGDAMFIH